MPPIVVYVTGFMLHCAKTSVPRETDKSRGRYVGLDTKNQGMPTFRAQKHIVRTPQPPAKGKLLE